MKDQTWFVQKSIELDDGRISIQLIVGITASSKEEAQSKVVMETSDDRAEGTYDLRPEAWSLAAQLDLGKLTPVDD